MKRSSFKKAKVVEAVEIDPFSRHVLSHHNPNIQLHDDVRTYHPTQKIDIICGGFPCTGTSKAGKRTGLLHEESGLAMEFLRVVCEAQPRLVVVENPEGLIDRGLRAFLGGLRMAGYQAEVEIVSAASQGAPHRRNRLFIFAYPDHLFVPGGDDSRRENNFERGDRNQETLSGETGSQTTGGSGQPGSVGVDDGVPTWLCGVGFGGWWRRNPPPQKAGIGKKEIHPSLRRKAISQYGLSVCPEQSAIAWEYAQDLWEKLTPRA